MNDMQELVYETIIHWEEGGGKRSRRELARRIVDLYAEQAERQEPVAIRIPKEGDRVICIEDDSAGTVWWTAADGGPYIKFDDGSYGQWSLREFGNLFRYAAPPQRQPLTTREVELLDGMIEVQLRHAKQCDGIGNRTMAEKQKGWDMERVALLQKLKAAHGIGGGE